MRQNYDEWMNDSAAFENFTYGQLPRENEAEIERKLDRIKERRREVNRSGREAGNKNRHS